MKSQKRSLISLHFVIENKNCKFPRMMDLFYINKYVNGYADTLVVPFNCFRLSQNISLVLS